MNHNSRDALWDHLRADESGATMAEYGIMITLVAVAVAAAAELFGLGVSDLFERGLAALP